MDFPRPRVPASESPAITQPLPDLSTQGLFQCGTCKRTFARVDHLTRHVRSHTQEKPYVCQTCTKPFARVDLLKRHALGHKTDSSGNKRQKRFHAVRTSRVTQACEACAEVHLRCEETKPCTRCKKKQIPCLVPPLSLNHEDSTISAAEDLLGLAKHVSPSNQPETDKEQSQEISPTQFPSSGSLQSEHVDHVTNQEAMDQDIGTYDQNFNPPQHENMDPPATPQVGFLHSANHAMRSTPLVDAAYQTFPNHTEDFAFPDFLRNMHSNSDQFFSGTWTPRGVMDSGFELNLELNDLDLSFLDKYNAQIPFDTATPQSSTSQGAETQISAEMPHEGVAIRTEAYRKSVWRYLPKSQVDFAGCEQPNLAFPVSGDHESAESRINIPRRASAELDRASRDKLLALVLSTCKPANVAQTVAAFPSLELLDSLIQYFLTAPVMDAGEYLHIPTLSPTSKNNPALVAVLVSAGAVLTPDVPLRKLGFAIQEAARVSMSHQFEDDNAAIRDMQLQQAFSIELRVGFWSGVSRKMEIAESFLQPLTTMIRRGGKFRHSAFPRVSVSQTDDGINLDKIWKQWVHQESYLRLVFRVFEHDAQSSMALLKRPLIGYSEMQLPLPEAGDIWYASSAQSWKNAYLSRGNISDKRPSLIDCLNDLECLNNLRTLADSETASLAFLYAVWGLIWEYRQLTSVIKKTSHQWSDGLIMTSRHQELIKLLQDFRISSDVIARHSSSNVELVLELLLMHLQVSLEDVQLFAGIDGQEEARRVYPSLREWVTTPASRQAVWHAGQILRAAGRLRKGFLRDFNAIAVYHAGLTFWAYGLLKESTPMVTSHTAPIADVWLDGHDNMDVRRFTTLDRGAPGLRGANSNRSPVHINETSATMNFMIDILRANHEATGGPVPPLVENLVQLMEGLRQAVR